MCKGRVGDGGPGGAVLFRSATWLDGAPLDGSRLNAKGETQLFERVLIVCLE